ncbi:MAG: aconitase family protein, partial [Phycisphaerales bacterium]
MPLTLIEKLASRHAVGLAPGAPVRSGDFVTIRPKHIMTHDNTGAVMPKFREIFKAAGKPPAINDPRQPVFAIDHDIQNTTPDNLGKYLKIEQFAREHGVDFYPAGTGISHQVMVEQGYVVPGSMVVGSDSHSNLYGALCCLGTPVVRTDAASLWASGTTWWQVPPVARVTLNGRLRDGVVGKDIIIALCGIFARDEVLNHAVEFVGPGVATLSIDQRMSIANMSTEWG